MTKSNLKDLTSSAEVEQFVHVELEFLKLSSIEVSEDKDEEELEPKNQIRRKKNQNWRKKKNREHDL